MSAHRKTLLARGRQVTAAVASVPSSVRRKRAPEIGWRSGASRLGISFEAYRAHIEDGEKWCTRCQRWQPISDFVAHAGRSGGLSGECAESNRLAARMNMRRLRELAFAEVAS